MGVNCSSLSFSALFKKFKGESKAITILLQDVNQSKEKQNKLNISLDYSRSHTWTNISFQSCPFFFVLSLCVVNIVLKVKVKIHGGRKQFLDIGHNSMGLLYPRSLPIYDKEQLVSFFSMGAIKIVVNKKTKKRSQREKKYYACFSYHTLKK